jgi:hypothetical protein
VQTTVNTIGPKVDNVQTTVNTMQSTVNTLGSTVDDVQTSLGAVQTTVDSVETKVNDIKANLNQIPPVWSQIIPLASDRFQLVLGGTGVLDRETGLVWEQSPETFPNPSTSQTWINAQSSCNIRIVGGRLGWRVPTLQELASLIDRTQFEPALPSGHPFSNVSFHFTGYWSASTLANDSSNAWRVPFDTGLVGFGAKTVAIHVWCVRGGQGVDPQ